MTQLSPGTRIEERDIASQPYFSICIPQYNRTNYLLRAIDCYASQSFSNFEVCISDDCSPDGRQEEIVARLRERGLAFVFEVRSTNSRYDRNLRAAMALCRGHYILLMGNDDQLANNESLAELHSDIISHGPASAVITNYADFKDQQEVKRVPETRNYGSGPNVIAQHFRNFSLVSGVLLSTESANAAATDRWDGSEYYHLHIASKLIASGGSLLEVNRVVVHKDIYIENEEVDSYAKRPLIWPCPIVERKLPLRFYARLVTDGMADYVPQKDASKLNEDVILQVYRYTYAYWLTQYRRVQSRRFALGVAIGMRPKVVTEMVKLSWWRMLRIRSVYLIVTVVAILIPLGMFDRLKNLFYRIAKRQ